MNLANRSYQLEILDNPGIPFQDIARNMAELNIINSYLGGHDTTLNGIKKLINKNTPERLHIAEIGCGGGDNLKVIHSWCSRNNIYAEFTGIDINGECIKYAESVNKYSNIQFKHTDYKLATFDTKPDIIFSSLFCHHFDEASLVSMIYWLNEHSGTGYFINDLHRHKFAYYSIKSLTRLFSKSYLVKNDAPVSVLRGFKRKDWTALMQKAGIKTYSLTWHFAFRWLLVVIVSKKSCLAENKSNHPNTSSKHEL